VVVGGLLALRWRWTFVLHFLAVIWAIAIATVNFPRPLTTIEQWVGENAGMAPLPPEGFIAHYIAEVIYPAAWLGAVQAIAFAVVAVSWIVYRGFPVTCRLEAQSPPSRTARAVPAGSSRDR
jgi:hypothetical protein